MSGGGLKLGEDTEKGWRGQAEVPFLIDIGGKKEEHPHSSRQKATNKKTRMLALRNRSLNS